MSQTATYVYAVARRSRAPTLRGAPAGLPHCGAPRLLDAGDGLWAIVAEAPLAHYGQAELERGLQDMDWVTRHAVAHEEVVEHFMRSGALVPMKLFTLFSSDARALSHLRRIRRRIERVAERVSGCEEWSIRMQVDRSLASRAARERGRAAARGGSGAGYLQGKKAARDEVSRITRDGGAEADQLFERLTERASEARRRGTGEPESTSALLLDAAFLVPSRRARGFEREARRQAERLQGAGYALTVSGPWPPYHFVEEGSR